jgi:hypothetical protein
MKWGPVVNLLSTDYTREVLLIRSMEHRMISSTKFAQEPNASRYPESCCHFDVC